MGGLGKKRRASSVEGSDSPDAAPAAVKKAKSAAAPAGKDDEGNPYWEVRLNHICGPRYQELTRGIALQQAPRRSFAVQEHVLRQCSRVLRQGWQNAPGEKGMIGAPATRSKSTDCHAGNFSICRTVCRAAQGGPRHQRRPRRPGLHGQQARGRIPCTHSDRSKQGQVETRKSQYRCHKRRR